MAECKFNTLSSGIEYPAPLGSFGFSGGFTFRTPSGKMGEPVNNPNKLRDIIMKLLVPFIAVLLTVGCTTSKVIMTAPGTYMVNSSGAGFSTGSVRANVFKAANKYCASKGLEPAPISFKAIPGVLARNPPTADLIFICLEHGDPAINS